MKVYCFTLIQSPRAKDDPNFARAVEMEPVSTYAAALAIRANGGLLFPHRMDEVAAAVSYPTGRRIGPPSCAGSFSVRYLLNGTQPIYLPARHDLALYHCIMGELPRRSDVDEEPSK